MEKINARPPYTLIRSSRRSMALEIRPGGVVLVRVPKGVSDRAARIFVAGYRDRVMESVERMKALPRADEPDASAKALAPRALRGSRRPGVLHRHQPDEQGAAQQQAREAELLAELGLGE